MNVLVACEESQVVTKELRNLGHNAYSCDIIPCSGGKPEWHILGDCRPLLNGNGGFQTESGGFDYLHGRWDMIIAFPPCTFITNAGAVRMWINGEINQERYQKAMKAKKFFLTIYNADCNKIAIENPTPMKMIGLPPYSQAIQPWMFIDPTTGDSHLYTKRTCLWLKGLPQLVPDIITKPAGVMPFINAGSLDANGNQRKRQGRKERDSKSRSKTFLGIGRAMAQQWGGKADG